VIKDNQFYFILFNAKSGDMAARLTRIERIFTDLICGNPLNPRHPRSHWCSFGGIGLLQCQLLSARIF
jgi:hypothetical protein